MRKRLRRHVNGRLRNYFAVTAPGFEGICKEELIKIGFTDEQVKVIRGGVSFQGKLIDCLKANLHLRTANRILMRVRQFKASNFRKLGKEVEKISWELFLPKQTELNFQIYSKHSRLYHKNAISECIASKISNTISLLKSEHSRTPKQTIFVRIIDNNVSVSLDSTGELLYKRGLKHGQNKAPIRETTAAALLLLMGINESTTLVDPMCGSGTFSLEAAMIAKHILPGSVRKFSFMKWPAFRSKQWYFLKNCNLKQTEVFKKPSIHASDKSKKSCEILRKQIYNHNLGDIITVNSKNFFDLKTSDFSQKPGAIIINPPYGIRLGSKQHSKILFEKICFHLEKFKNWNVGLISPPVCDHYVAPLKLNKYPIINGGLRLNFFFGKII